MSRARSATSIIWSTVVSAAAMLGTVGCAKSPASTTPVAHEFESTGPAEPVEVNPVVDEPPVVVTPPVEEPAIAVAAPAPAPVAVTIESSPAGADIYLDGVQLGTTPMKVEVPSSNAPLTVRVSRDGYDDKELTIGTGAGTIQVTLVKTKRVRGSTIGTIKVGGHGKGTGRGFILS